ncbi:MAG: enoyl-CoA hydratase [Alphaproteobacteria bacterium]|nr:MAG: enoyl-CoA hydratase [Alphaproteobacteria bacterium]
MTPKNALVLVEKKEGVVRITLNRPDARNSLSLDLMTALQAELDRIAEDRSARVVLLAGNGKAFCAGHDLKEMLCLDEAAYQPLFESCSRIMLTLRRMPQPVIARVHAMATAAGCQLVASCDLAVAGRSARFATPGVNIGLFCSTPMVALSRNVPAKLAMHMLLTGEPINADEALQYGLVSQVVDDEKLDVAVNALARNLAAKSSPTLALGKAAFYRQSELSEEDAYRFTSAVMAQNLKAHDAQEGIQAFLDKRDPVWNRGQS